MPATAVPAATDPRMIERPLADLRPGDRIHAVRSARTGDWTTLRRPLLVTHAIAPVALGGPAGVRLWNGTGVDHVLYPDSIDVVETVRERGQAGRDSATRLAAKAAGWSTKGGRYFRADPSGTAEFGYPRFLYTGIASAVEAGVAFTRDGWIVQIGQRWYVTHRPAEYARLAAIRPPR